MPAPRDDQEEGNTTSPDSPAPQGEKPPAHPGAPAPEPEAAPASGKEKPVPACPSTPGFCPRFD